jgi:hypothetical protein
MSKMLKKQTLKIRICCFALCCLMILETFPRPAAAHNKVVHEGMTVRALLLMMKSSSIKLSINEGFGNPPEGVSAAEWKSFQDDIVKSFIELKKMVGVTLTTNNSLEGTEVLAEKLSFAASEPDYHIDDVHLFTKLSNAAGQSWLDKAADTGIKGGAGVILIPFICAGLCIGDLFGLSDCDDCLDKAKQFGNKVPTPSDLKNLIPGFGDDTDEDYVGLWHFINMSDNPTIENDYDDHQGILYERAGPFGVPGSVDILIMVGSDLVGKSVNGEKSDGVKRYQMTQANDFFFDGDSYSNTIFRSNFEWEKYSLGHTVFSSVDNFALWGWRGFRNNTEPNPANRFLKLGYSLHAIGDATVPMHVTGTTSWGHRAYENAQEELWDEINSQMSDKAILAQAFKYRQQIQSWRAEGHPGDIPMRHLVRAVARNTYDYSMLQQLSTKTFWPFNDEASLLFFSGKADDNYKTVAVDMYKYFPNAVGLVKPLMEDGIAAELAVLMSAPEGVLVAQNSPGYFNNPSFLKANWSANENNLNSNAKTAPPVETNETPATDSQVDYYNAVRSDYRRLASLLINDKISPAEYLQRVWDRTRKSDTARRDAKFAEELGRGDKDGDLIPDTRDRCPNTPPADATDNCGCTLREPLPKAPSRRDMQKLFKQMNIMVNPQCNPASSPETPRPLTAGVSSLGTSVRNPTFSVLPVENQPAGCPVYYEFAVRFDNVFEGNKAILPVNAEREVVFRHTDGQLLVSNNQKRMLFRILRDLEPNVKEQKFMMTAWGRYDDYRWRVRAVNGNGMSSAWSEWQKFDATAPV